MDTKDKHGHSLLSHATRYGSEVVEKLLVAQDDVEVDTARGTRRSGVHNDARSGHMTTFMLRLYCVCVPLSGTHAKGGHGRLYMHSSCTI